MQFKGISLHILMSLSEPKTFSFKLNKSLFRAIKLPWSHAKCTIRDQFTSSPSKLASTDQGTMAAESQSVCSATCEDPSFTVRSDGLCKAEHQALLGIADDDLAPLCPPAMKGLAKFLVCGLEQEVDSLKKADFSPPSVSVMFDSTYNKSLYIVNVYMALPQDSSLIFSNSKNDIFQNILHVALMARSFKNYRLSEKFCQQNERENKITDLEVISTSPIASVVNMMSGNWTFSYAMKKLRSEILDNQTTITVCLGALNSFFDTNQYPFHLLCMDDPVYERDASWIRKFRHSPCFAHLENLEPLDGNQAIRSTENQEIWHHWALSLNVFVTLIMKI
ncbi:hypothetical protein PoB_002508000 [Plakobranchus ocellatus]|uniref:Uncharacterized protein n=1 Tax=Plakobranchus ocellatus TaxID=259542 RepID=A0AAV3ZVD7_9GAST|nr:hypothetical protein PoB_002508000 [Plakobranchus ocellatus]